MSGDFQPLPPPPVPPPPPPTSAPSVPSKKKLYQAIAEGKTAVAGDFEEACLLLKQRETIKDLQWVLFNKYVPSLIQDGPKCGLVALWIAAHLLKSEVNLSMEQIIKTALNKGYTAQGEMFSASDMALLAEEVCGCRVQKLSGGMMGDNAACIVKHLTEGQPILIPYDEDFNHEPCVRSGHKAHWAVASGVLLGMEPEKVTCKDVLTGTTLPWLYLSKESAPATWISTAVDQIYILAKQGKSLRYQLWKFETVAQSNAQLRELDPQRAADGCHYVLPPGGVEAGLAGQVVLLHV